MSIFNHLTQSAFWQSLAERERRLLTGLAIFLLLVMIYLLGWKPYQAAIDLQQAKLAQAKVEWQWLQSQVNTVQQLKTQPTKAMIHHPNQLLQTIEATLKQQNLLSVVDALQANNTGVVVRFASVNAPRLLRWLVLMEQQGVFAVQVDLQPLSPGLTKAELRFEVRG